MAADALLPFRDTNLAWTYPRVYSGHRNQDRDGSAVSLALQSSLKDM